MQLSTGRVSSGPSAVLLLDNSNSYSEVAAPSSAYGHAAPSFVSACSAMPGRTACPAQHQHQHQLLASVTLFSSSRTTHHRSSAATLPFASTIFASISASTSAPPSSASAPATRAAASTSSTSGRPATRGAQNSSNSNSSSSTHSSDDTDPITANPYFSAAVPSSLSRRPLLPAERGAAHSKICVTGATGYIGSRAVERLLAGGHTVHALVLPSELQQAEATRHLTDLPGADRRLKLFAGDVRAEGGAGGVTPALRGCGSLLHLAAVVDLLPVAAMQGVMVDTALGGARRVLDSAAAVSSLRRVVLSSSVAAVVGDNWERGRDHVYDERDWAQDCAPGYNTYSYSKSRSEKLARDWAAAQSRISLVTVNPGVVFGPVRIRQHAMTSPGMLRGVLSGGPVIDLHSAFADVDDVAAALCAAALQRGAEGRHIVAARVCGLHEIAGRLHQLFPTFNPKLVHVPRWLVAAVPGWLWRSLGTDAAVVKATLGKPMRLDSSRVLSAHRPCTTNTASTTSTPTPPTPPTTTTTTTTTTANPSVGTQAVQGKDGAAAPAVDAGGAVVRSGLGVGSGLGLGSYLPFDDTLTACGASLMALGLVPRHQSAGQGA